MMAMWRTATEFDRCYTSPLAGEEGAHCVSSRRSSASPDADSGSFASARSNGKVRGLTPLGAGPLTLPLRGSLPLPQGERGCLPQMHIFVLDRQIVDAAIGRRDPARHLAGRGDFLHE